MAFLLFFFLLSLLPCRAYAFAPDSLMCGIGSFHLKVNKNQEKKRIFTIIILRKIFAQFSINYQKAKNCISLILLNSFPKKNKFDKLTFDKLLNFRKNHNIS
uniref:(northern house mosquito) hypothetical protein n=1 Tax=Culex pipiens TaxID=7175 RepID=A0A8D8D7Y4_CULPI